MLLGFKPQFRPLIENGTKIHTLRNIGKRFPKHREQLHMYTGLRTKNCKLITREHILKRLQTAYLRFERQNTNQTNEKYLISISLQCKLYRHHLNDEEIETFAVNDGFSNKIEMAKFFLASSGVKKDGVCEGKMKLIQWTDFRYEDQFTCQLPNT